MLIGRQMVQLLEVQVDQGLLIEVKIKVQIVICQGVVKEIFLLQGIKIILILCWCKIVELLLSLVLRKGELLMHKVWGSMGMGRLILERGNHLLNREIILFRVLGNLLLLQGQLNLRS